MTVQTGISASLLYKGERVGKVRNFNVSTQRQALDTTSLGDTDRTYVPGIRQSSGSATLMYQTGDSIAKNLMQSIQSNSVEADAISFKLNGANGVTADAIITEVSVGVSTGDITQVNLSFQLTGPVDSSL